MKERIAQHNGAMKHAKVKQYELSRSNYQIISEAQEF
jgi:hypothetical protein